MRLFCDLSVIHALDHATRLLFAPMRACFACPHAANPLCTDNLCTLKLVHTQWHTPTHETLRAAGGIR